MTKQIFNIRREPIFRVILEDDKFEIIKDNNSLNNRTYIFNDLISIEIAKEVDQSIFYLLRFLIGNVSFGHRNPAVLKIKTTQQKNTLYLRECNLDRLKEFIEIVNQKLESKQIEK